jgi:GxxExxY protein
MSVSWDNQIEQEERRNGGDMNEAERLNLLTERIIGVCIDVHSELGPGLLESVYEECLCLALDAAFIGYVRQGSVPVVFRGQQIDQGFRFDLLVEREVIVEVKAVEQIMSIHKAQVLTYLKLTGAPLGLLINFHVPVLKEGIRRLVNPASGLDVRVPKPFSNSQ